MVKEDQDDHSHVDDQFKRQETQNNSGFQFFPLFQLYTQLELLLACFLPFP